jgi:hypothetical protein
VLPLTQAVALLVVRVTGSVTGAVQSTVVETAGE